MLHALEIEEALRCTHISGASAGALVGGLFASGIRPAEMIDPVMAIQRKDMWDVGGIGGLLKGNLCHEILRKCVG